tara:strand:- start:1842 stop:2015 length:174 start_codon:yes stop_codon:yes gene_type:complete
MEYAIFFILLIGCGWSSYQLGVKEGVRAGAENTVDVLQSLNIISINKKGDIIPYRKS